MRRRCHVPAERTLKRGRAGVRNTITAVPAPQSDYIGSDDSGRFCCGAATFVAPPSYDGTAGSCTTNAVPASPPSIHTRPPCSATIVETMASPRPVPPESRGRPSPSRTKRSNTRCRSATGIPGPSSATMSVAVGTAALSPPDDGGRNSGAVGRSRCRWRAGVHCRGDSAPPGAARLYRRGRVRARYLWCRSSAGLAHAHLSPPATPGRRDRPVDFAVGGPRGRGPAKADR